MVITESHKPRYITHLRDRGFLQIDHPQQIEVYLILNDQDRGLRLGIVLDVSLVLVNSWDD